MTSEEKKRLRKEIQEQINLASKELEDLKDKAQSVVSDRSHGRMGQLNAIQQKDAHARRIKFIENNLHGLERNLISFDSPEFGVCEHCNEPIGEARRKALPGARICIKCAEKFSKK